MSPASSQSPSLTPGCRSSRRGEHQQGGARRPCLGAGGARVGDRDRCDCRRIAREDLGKTMLEVRRGGEHRGGDRDGLLTVAVAREPRDDQRVVMRPHGSGVVTERVVAALFDRRASARPSPNTARSSSRRSAVAAASRRSSRPDHSRCPMFEVRLSTWRFSPSRATAWQPRSGIQKSRRNDVRRSLPAAPNAPRAPGRATPRAPGARRDTVRHRRIPGSHMWRSGREGGVPSANWIPSQLSFQH